MRLIGDPYRIPEGDHRSWQGCNLDLTGVTIDGNMDFTDAVFSGGSVDFTGARFSGGRVEFGSAVFSGGRVEFGSAVFSGGSMTFEVTAGPAPVGLLAAVGTPVPSEVRLRTDWLPPGS
ncbi:pentapeptide repeat-containing protein [Streptomyces canus]|uniref:pentapeptide repeat-containing protein n=1 Tax=Streptomyces canus TaxID=58343 RepID=UPI0027D8C990|nr:pentapeptide repeat-containing protein [Streptomyces canus]